MAYIQESSISSIPSRHSKRVESSSLRTLVRNLKKDIEALQTKKVKHEQEHQEIVESIKKQISLQKERLLAKKKEQVLARLQASMIAQENETINKQLYDINFRSSLLFDKKKQLQAAKTKILNNLDNNREELTKLSAVRYMIRQEYRQLKEKEANVLKRLQLQKVKNCQEVERISKISLVYEQEHLSCNRLAEISQQQQDTISQQNQQIANAHKIIQEIDIIHTENTYAIERYNVLKKTLVEKNHKTMQEIEQVQKNVKNIEIETEELQKEQKNLNNVVSQLQEGLNILQQFSLQASKTSETLKKCNEQVVRKMLHVASMEQNLSERVLSMRNQRKEVALKVDKILN